MATMTIYHVGEAVRVVSGPFKGMTGVVRDHTRLPVDNIHIVNFDAPTEQKVDSRGPVPFEDSPFSGPYAEFKPEELESVVAA